MVGHALRVCGVVALLFLSATCASPSTPVVPSNGQPPPVIVPATTTAAVAAGVVPISVDGRGAPRLVRAVRPLPAPAGATPEQAARAHLGALAPIYGAPAVRANDAALVGVVPVRNGATAVTLRQQIDGVPVLGADLRVLLHPDGALAAVSGTMVATRPTRPSFRLAATDALAAAVAAEYAVSVTATVRSRRAGGWVALAAPPMPGLTLTEAHARPVLAPSGGTLVPAYHVELFASAGHQDDALRFVVAAADGRVLERRDLTADETYIYRAWADPTGDRRPYDGPHASTAPHPTGVPDAYFPAFVPPNLVAVDSLNSHGDPWLPPGATVSAGNNVDAYVDLHAPDGLSDGDFRADVTTPNAFDHAYDITRAPLANQTQSKAAAVSLFYTINWLHDWFYDSGFVEAAGNAQLSNYGRGGVEGDSMRAEAQDNALGGSRNNANMSTPSDGIRPRMQVFLWSGVNQRRIVLDGTTELATNTAAFGPTDFDLTGEVVVGDDGVAPGGDACEPLVNDVAGKIALVDRGVCTFAIKAQNAQAAGAIGVIVANNAAGVAPPALGGVDPTIVIPVLSITLEAGADLRASLLVGPVSARMFRESGVEQEGSLDTTVVAHEWGHYLHHRLSDCGTKQCGALSEGWADFIALHTMLRPDADWTGTFAVGPYSTRGTAFPDAAYFGIRRYPYSVDRTRNPLSFRHIQRGVPLPPITEAPRAGGPSDNDQVHNSGEVWASMLWEVYAALLDEHGYDEGRRRMSDYVVTGLLMTPIDATYTDARDGILAAVSALEPADLERVAGGFAARGNGSCAVAPSASSQDFVGVVESDQLAGRIAIGGLSLTDDHVSCDDDGYLDAGEVGVLHVTIANAGPVALTDIEVTVASATDGIEALDDAQVATLAPYASIEVTIPVRIGVEVAPESDLALTITTTAEDACETTVAASLTGATGRDETTATSATDDVEVLTSPWVAAGSLEGVWARASDGAGGHFLHGRDVGTLSDTFLASPPLEVSATEPFSVTLQHAFRFEGDAGTLYDGGVIEVSSDDGETWVDATTLTTAPIAYTGALSSCCDNPLAGRAAFSRSSVGFPARSELVLDFGTALAGQTVQLRFRIGTDVGAGAYGWEIDDLVFAGIDNTPFGEVIEEGPTCQAAPIASAGPDQEVEPTAAVDLDGTGSADPNGEPITFAWTQIGGDAVTLDDATAAAPSFTAPDVTADTTLTFELVVTDVFGLSGVDQVDVVVAVEGPGPDGGVPPDAGTPPDAEPPDPPGDGDGGGCGCRTDGRGDAGGLVLVLAALGLALGRSRRTASPG